MHLRRARAAWLIGTSLNVGAWACSSAPTPSPMVPVAPPPATPSPIASGSPPDAQPVPALSSPASVDASPAPVANPQLEAAATPADDAQPGKPARSAIDILTSPDTAFLINYAGSGPMETARQACTEKSGGDPAAQAKCLTDAREAFKADVIRFRKDGSHWSWTVYKRAGNRLDEVTSGRVTMTETSPGSVNIKFVTDKGLRPLLKNKREAVISVPNDYSFELDDPDWGKLMYEAKIGLVAS